MKGNAFASSEFIRKTAVVSLAALCMTLCLSGMKAFAAEIATPSAGEEDTSSYQKLEAYPGRADVLMVV